MWYASDVLPYPTSSAYIFASLFLACSRDSSIIIPAPSLITKPSRCISNGLHALSGSSLLVESAFIEVKPANANGVIGASEPPVMAISISPRSINLKASPIA